MFCAMPAESSVLLPAAKIVCTTGGPCLACPEFGYNLQAFSHRRLWFCVFSACNGSIKCCAPRGCRSVPAGKRAGLVLCNASTEFFCFGILVGFELISALAQNGLWGCGQQVDSYKIHAHNKWFQRTPPAAAPLNQALAA